MTAKYQRIIIETATKNDYPERGRKTKENVPRNGRMMRLGKSQFVRDPADSMRERTAKV